MAAGFVSARRPPAAGHFPFPPSRLRELSMNATSEMLAPWLRALLDPAASESLKLEEYLRAIPRLAALSDVPGGTAVLIRGDVDAKPGPQIGDGDIRLRSMIPTLK